MAELEPISRGVCRAATCGRRGLLVIAVLLGALCALTIPQAAAARGALRCGNRLVSDGDPIDQVFRRCGEPSFRTVSTEVVSVETSPGVFVSRAIPVETWTYNRGPREFVRYLTFRNGRLARIDEGDYGY